VTLELGTKVHFDHSKVLWREHLTGGKRRWQSVNWNKGYMEGVIVGWRTLANGRVTYGNDWDGSDQFRPTEHFKAYLVAYDLRRKPVYVLPENLEEIND
jgi:hypothetical protein